MNTKSIADAFSWAETLNFKLLFSFDYAGRGVWEKEDVRFLISKYAASAAYFRHQGRPLVTTFEGSANASDWIDIKSATGCAKVALQLAAWPWGGQDMDTYVDASYKDYLGAKPYMMPVAPWFYTNLPGFDNKNWAWRGDHLWHDRWEQVKFWQPEWVCILTWNDYGESHHIGPIRDNAMNAFKTGLAKYNYAHDHDGWRTLLPHQIDLYKYDTVKITQEGASFWYRPNPKDACPSGGTTVNTASQLQLEFRPQDVLEDRIYYSVLATSETDVVITISVGGVDTVGGAWRNKPAGGAGIYHGSVPINGRTGPVYMLVMRGTDQIASIPGTYITNVCQEVIANYDAWAGGAIHDISTSVTTPSRAAQVCVEGTGAYEFKELCTFACKYGYCPEGACVCTAMGLPRTRPTSTTVKVYPVAGLGSSYSGLCSSACQFGDCPAKYCGTVQVALAEPTVSPFLPPSCISGTSNSAAAAAAGEYESLCSYTCAHGFCPIALCSCSLQGPLVFTPPILAVTASSLKAADITGICRYGCERGVCPSFCTVTRSPGTGGEVVVPDDSVTSVSHLDRDCFRFEECVMLDILSASSCGAGYKRVGVDQADCGNNGDGWGRPICCKQEANVSQCIWRGNGGDCNGQCQEGETHLLYSGHGGIPRGPDDNTDQCKRGYKFFCCQQPAYHSLVDECYWSTW
ncbi:mutanase [Cercophora scortea]|uniref:Mutanase n=1 Tax=Cercophora scortea TaxID=314031 RepID=A0AAE0IL02_9PEZI|nr:mutanase [Cercophora scortea]